jgi:hypothetical protein
VPHRNQLIEGATHFPSPMFSRPGAQWLFGRPVPTCNRSTSVREPPPPPSHRDSGAAPGKTRSPFVLQTRAKFGTSGGARDTGLALLPPLSFPPLPPIHRRRPHPPGPMAAASPGASCNNGDGIPDAGGLRRSIKSARQRACLLPSLCLSEAGVPWHGRCGVQAQ